MHEADGWKQVVLDLRVSHALHGVRVSHPLRDVRVSHALRDVRVSHALLDVRVSHVLLTALVQLRKTLTACVCVLCGAGGGGMQHLWGGMRAARVGTGSAGVSS